MMCIIELIQFWILTVDCQCILGQVVCSNTEEINLLGKLFTDHDSRRCLDHDTDFNIFEWNSGLSKFFFYFFQNLFNLPYFINRNNHREHDGNISVCARPQQCSELCFKYFFSRQTDTDCAVSESRIFLFIQFKIIHLFVSTDIQCPDNHFLSGHVFRNSLVCIKLLCLCRICVGFQIEEFTSEQTDSFRVVHQNRCCIRYTSDVCIQMNFFSIFCNRLLSF